MEYALVLCVYCLTDRRADKAVKKKPGAITQQVKVCLLLKEVGAVMEDNGVSGPPFDGINEELEEKFEKLAKKVGLQLFPERIC